MTPTRAGRGAKVAAVAPRPGTQQLPAVSRVAFDSAIGFGSAQGVALLGSRLATLPVDGGALAFWADTRRATEDNNAQELALAQVQVDEGGDRRWALAGAGGVLAAGGATVLGRRR